MKNEEKAQEIADMFFLDEDIELNTTTEECNISCKNAALTMAECKDKEFKEYLLNKKYDMMTLFNITHDGDFLSKCTVYDNILNELFK